MRDASCWQREHEWRQDIAVVTKWLSGVSPVINPLFDGYCLVDVLLLNVSDAPQRTHF